jgi:hypothetical protein
VINEFSRDRWDAGAIYVDPRVSSLFGFAGGSLSLSGSAGSPTLELLAATPAVLAPAGICKIVPSFPVTLSVAEDTFGQDCGRSHPRVRRKTGTRLEKSS